jgi:hypothetical protein
MIKPAPVFLNQRSPTSPGGNDREILLRIRNVAMIMGEKKPGDLAPLAVSFQDFPKEFCTLFGQRAPFRIMPGYLFHPIVDGDIR